ncbi:FliO/MopB family protein [Comamonas testosteroni]|uniref:FliO/MopB family protein n=1 Tax=Comamonas testosteroni TaxID=285 RepID=UPI00265D8E37|nr:flagellar biosynthetic protein FliO [Comamonas testosteroni]WKL18588.1 flagellar biosynthetic protein FliO [Comamonas testosteroni]WQD45683.1 flagellar biosynthetic protein FliO [Comamonas testosteroni]
MWPTLLLVILFVAVMAALPWLVRRLQQKNLLPRGMGMARGATSVPAQVLSTLAIGPQQRVLTVQLGEGEQVVRLVLGVTAQQIQCLHVLQDPSASLQSARAAHSPAVSSFTDSLMRAQADEAARNSGNV